MAVQIYQNEELNDIVFQVEALDEWKQIVSDLGMECQSKFVEKSESPIPYPYINNGMEVIFKTLCPSEVDFKKYDKTPIPLEVMRQIAFSVKERHFQEIKIWFDDKTPDPFAIGVAKDYFVYDSSWNHMKNADNKTMYFTSESEAKNYAETIGFKISGVTYTNMKKYLIARWADELRPIEELREIAKQRLLETIGAELKNTIKNASQALEKIKENVTLYIGGQITLSELKNDRVF